MHPHTHIYVCTPTFMHAHPHAHLRTHAHTRTRTHGDLSADDSCVQKIQNASAILSLKPSQQEHAKPLLEALHWLPISDGITYKCPACVTTPSLPPSLNDLLQIYTPFCAVWSTTNTHKLKILLFKKKYSGQRSFSYQGPVTWNNLPFSIRHTQTYSSFKSQLKTHLFSQTFQ